MRDRRWFAAAMVVAVALAAGATAPLTGVAGAATKPATRRTLVAPIGRYTVGQLSATFVDTSRATGPNGTFPGAPSRTLLTAIYYPATGPHGERPTPNAPVDTADGPYPMILFSHGVLARGVFYEAVLKQWASAGYVVVAPDYPLSNTNAPGGVDFGRGVADVKNQPADASFVISQVLKADKATKLVGGTIDPRRIGAAGHSLGAITTYGLVYSRCCRDPRVLAAVPMSGVPAVVESGANYFQGPSVPLLALHGNADPIVPYQADLNGFAAAKAPKYFVTFLNGGHITPFLGGNDPLAVALQRSTVDFWDRYLKGDGAALAKLAVDARVPGGTVFQSEAVAARAAR